MKQIEVFVDYVYQNIGGNRKEILDLKAEMKSHLLEAVHELRAEGKTEQQAIEIAIERFGGENEMRSIVGQLFQAQKTFARWVLYLAITFLVLSSTVFGFIWATEEENSHENRIVATKISVILHNKETISDDMKTQIIDLVKRTNQISKIQIYSFRDFERSAESFTSIFAYVEKTKPNFEYEKKVWAPRWLLVEFIPYGNGDSEWFVDMETGHLESFMILVLFIGVTVYAVLFTIWATINAYHHKRLNIGWIILFALFNVLGYLVYFFSGKREMVN